MVLRTANAFPIYFARHGETVFNMEGRWQGNRNDSPLTARGREQARETGLILAELISLRSPPRFVTSPLGRARATLEIVLETLRLPRRFYEIDARLSEIDVGEWTGWLDGEVVTRDGARWSVRESDRWNVSAPGGESYAAAAVRAADWLSTVKSETVAITHGILGFILSGLYCGLAPTQICAMDELPHASVMRLQAGSLTPFRT